MKKKKSSPINTGSSAKRVKFTKQEDQIIINCINQLGKKWNDIANKL